MPPTQGKDLMTTLDALLPQAPTDGKRAGRIRQKNEELILSAAAEEFAHLRNAQRRHVAVTTSDQNRHCVAHDWVL